MDGYSETGIGRIEAARLSVLGKMRGRKQPAGALLPKQYVNLKLLHYPEINLPDVDSAFSSKIVKVLGKSRSRYGISVLDLSNPEKPLYAEYLGDRRQNVGSVGKLLVGLAFFQALADIYPDDVEARKIILKKTIVTADDFIWSDDHKVRFWNPETQKMRFRQIRIGDKGNLWEWLDWTMSASSNAAAATVMKQAMLLVQHGREYPLSDEASIQFFKNTPRKQLAELFVKTFIEPINRNGLNPELLRQASFFTHFGKKKVPGAGRSYGTARELMLFSLRMEQGRLVDTFSSREMKRLLYMTERRIRYASSPALAESAVYFKSGSLYKCKPEPNFSCEKYHGNVVNYMNSVAIVESPAGENRLNYMVTLLSNVLYKNSAVAHQTIGTRIHRVLESMHPVKEYSEEGIPTAANFGEHLIGYAEKRAKRLEIVNIQMALVKLGYAVGGVDGKVGRNTRKSIKKFQKSQGIKVNGKPSTLLLQKLNESVDVLDRSLLQSQEQ